MLKNLCPAAETEARIKEGEPHLFGFGNNNWLPWALLEDDDRRIRAATRKAQRNANPSRHDLIWCRMFVRGLWSVPDVFGIISARHTAGGRGRWSYEYGSSGVFRRQERLVILWVNHIQ